MLLAHSFSGVWFDKNYLCSCRCHPPLIPALGIVVRLEPSLIKRKERLFAIVPASPHFLFDLH